MYGVIILNTGVARHAYCYVRYVYSYTVLRPNQVRKLIYDRYCTNFNKCMNGLSNDHIIMASIHSTDIEQKGIMRVALSF